MSNSNVKLTIGGVVQAHNGTYLQRPADSQLLDACLAGEFAYVLACRQIGKSSLMNAVAENLVQKKVCVARVDLNRIGQNVTKADIWYFSLFEELARSLHLKTDIEIWWDKQPNRLTHSQRFIRFLEEVILSEIAKNVVIFIDEIDVTLGLPFTDDFFAAIRTVYNDRAHYPIFQRLTFVLLGVATPDELIKDKNRTPFNIGTAINLSDFTLEECKPLQAAIDLKHSNNSSLYFQRIYEWTNGHPYLTQKLCATVSKSREVRDINSIDELIGKIFSINEDYSDDNIRFVQDRVLGDPHVQQMLQAYRQILEDRTVYDDKESPAINRLKLYGLVVTKHGRLQSRNRLYRAIFNLDWIKTNSATTPFRRNYALALLITAFISLLVSISWFIGNPGLEPILALLGAVMTLLASLSMSDNPIRRFVQFRFYRREYLQYLLDRHQSFDVKGLTTQGVYTLDLAHVFVELTMRSQAPHEVTSNPIQLPEDLQQGQHTIWGYLQHGKQPLVILGPPGTGKTTLLKNVTLTLINRDSRKKNNAPNKLPIILFLRNHVQGIVNATKEQPYSLEDAIQKDLRRWGIDVPGNWFRNQLKKGRCLIMLDGLDEVSDPIHRQQVAAWVEQKIEIYKQNQFIITSRPHGYRNNPLSGVSILEIRPFNAKKQEEFIKNWYLANEILSQQKDDASVRMVAAEGATDLIRRLRSTHNLTELAVSPLLLTMIATIHKYRSSLPGRRVELYAEIFEVFLGKRQQAKGLFLDVTPSQRQNVLQLLSWYMMNQRQREISAEKAASIIQPALLADSMPESTPELFLKNIEQDSGLLVERESGVYAFSHITFQEYLAAAHILQDQQLLGNLLDHVTDSWWHETLLLYAAQTDATPIIEACLNNEKQSDINALLLAIDCAAEAQELQPGVLERLSKALDKAQTNNDPEQINLLSEARSRLHM